MSKPRKPLSFAAYLRNLQETHSSSVNEFASALGIDPSHLSRAMGDKGQPFDFHRCLRLAKLTGRDPAEVLRHAGKGATADQIADLYGAPREPLTAPQQEVLSLLKEVEHMSDRDDLQRVVLTFLRIAAARKTVKRVVGTARTRQG